MLFRIHEFSRIGENRARTDGIPFCSAFHSSIFQKEIKIALLVVLIMRITSRSKLNITVLSAILKLLRIF